MRATIYKASRGYRTEKQQRAACLRQLMRDNADGIQTLVILDQDDSLLRWDKQRLIELGLGLTSCRSAQQAPSGYRLAATAASRDGVH